MRYEVRLTNAGFVVFDTTLNAVIAGVWSQRFKAREYANAMNAGAS